MSQETSAPDLQDQASEEPQSFDEKPAGKQPEEQKEEVFEPGVEG